MNNSLTIFVFNVELYEDAKFSVSGDSTKPEFEKKVT